LVKGINYEKYKEKLFKSKKWKNLNFYI
jgi:hypothetical protein